MRVKHKTIEDQRANLEKVREAVKDKRFFQQKDVLQKGFSKEFVKRSLSSKYAKSNLQKFSVVVQGAINQRFYTFDLTATRTDLELEISDRHERKLLPIVQLEGDEYKRYLEIRRRKIEKQGCFPLIAHDRTFYNWEVE